ncbi:MAG: hypothetical protein AB7G13_22655 [Lautropia sp.]
MFRIRDSSGRLWTFTVSGEVLAAVDAMRESSQAAFDRLRPRLREAALRRQIDGDPMQQIELTANELGQP